MSNFRITPRFKHAVYFFLEWFDHSTWDLPGRLYHRWYVRIKHPAFTLAPWMVPTVIFPIPGQKSGIHQALELKKKKPTLDSWQTHTQPHTPVADLGFFCRVCHASLIRGTANSRRGLRFCKIWMSKRKNWDPLPGGVQAAPPWIH